MKLRIDDVVLVDDGNKLYVGRIDEIDGPHTLTLADASWVADTGRYGQFIRTGNGGGSMEIEPAGEIMLHYRSVSRWPHPLPTRAF